MPSQAPFTSLIGRGDRKSAWASGKEKEKMSGLIVSHSLSFLLRNLSLENDLSRAMEPLYDNETRTRGHTGWRLGSCLSPNLGFMYRNQHTIGIFTARESDPGCIVYFPLCHFCVLFLIVGGWAWYVSMCVHTHVYLQRPEALDLPRTRVTDNCELLNMGARNGTPALRGSSKCS